MDLLRYLFFENPLTLWIVLGNAGIVAGMIWMRTGSQRPAVVALSCMAAAVLIGLLASIIETNRERLVRTLDAMASAVEQGDADALMARVSPAYANGGADRAALAAVVERGLRQLRASAEAPVIALRDREATVTQVYVFRPAPGGRPLPPDYDRVTWEGTFAPDGDGEWRLRSVTSTQPRRLTPEEAARYLSKGAP